MIRHCGASLFFLTNCFGDDLDFLTACAAREIHRSENERLFQARGGCAFRSRLPENRVLRPYARFLSATLDSASFVCNLTPSR